MAPRLVQPCRLNFRWLSAADGDVEMNAHPATHPICGWRLPNLMDASLLVYDADGTVLGEIDRRAEWKAPPGRDVPIDSATLDNPQLRRVLDKLLSPEPLEERQKFLIRFTEVLEQALEEIDPEQSAHHSELSYVLGQPIAIVRAKLELQFQGAPSLRHSWAAFKQRVLASCGYCQLLFHGKNSIIVEITSDFPR